MRVSLAQMNKPQKVLTFFCIRFKKIFLYTETAHSVLGSDANDVVITVPFDFGEKQKSALG